MTSPIKGSGRQRQNGWSISIEQKCHKMAQSFLTMPFNRNTIKAQVMINPNPNTRSCSAHGSWHGGCMGTNRIMEKNIQLRQVVPASVFSIISNQRFLVRVQHLQDVILTCFHNVRKGPEFSILISSRIIKGLEQINPFFSMINFAGPTCWPYHGSTFLGKGKERKGKAMQG